jgi:hypothetical protein
VGEVFADAVVEFEDVEDGREFGWSRRAATSARSMRVAAKPGLPPRKKKTAARPRASTRGCPVR